MFRKQYKAMADPVGQDVEDMYDPVIKMTEPLLEAEVPKDEPTLFQAVRYVDYDMVERQLREGVDVNRKFESSVPYRVKSISMAHRVSMSNYAPLHLAVLHAPLTMIKLLLAKGADINICDGQMRTPLHLAVVTSRQSVIIYLIQSGADKNVQSSSGRTPLLEATLNLNKDCVRTLLGAGADPNLMDLKGTSVLSTLTFSRDTDMELLDLVLQSGCDVNIQNSKGGTPLMYAATMKKLDVMKRLLQAGANINQKDKSGCTALHLIIKGNRLSVNAALFLIHNGADTITPDKKGHSLLRKAVDSGNWAVIKILLASDVPNDVGNLLEHQTVQKICDYLPEFKTWLQEELSCPKSLKRLSRQCVRGCLTPDKLCHVTSLELPRILQDYLLVKDICRR